MRVFSLLFTLCLVLSLVGSPLHAAQLTLKPSAEQTTPTAPKAELPEETKLPGLTGHFRANIPCRDDEGVTYASYVPSSYHPENQARVWPLLLLFDPEGNGEQAVRAYAAAAESEGFLLAGCNQVRQQFDDELNWEAAQKTWIDLMTRFPIHLGRCFLGGSGAMAPFALECAAKSEVAGLLFVGWLPEQVPSIAKAEAPLAPLRFPLSAACGRMDAAFPTVLANGEALMQAKALFYLGTWPGNETWPTVEQALFQVQYLNLVALVQPLGEAQAEKKAAPLLVHANALVDQDPLEAERFLHALASVALPNTPVDPDEPENAKKAEHPNALLPASTRAYASLRSLRSSASAQQAASKLNKILTAELESRKLRNERFNQIPDQVELSQEEQAYWQAERAKLTQQFLSADSQAAKEAAGRELDWLAKAVFKRSFDLLEQRQFRSLAHLNLIAALLFPDNPFPYFNLVTAYSQLERVEDALKALALCREKGMPNLSELRNALPVRNLWSNPRFQELTQ